MKTEKTCAVIQCDICATDKNVYRRCLNCCQDMCFDCFKIHGVKYSHSVNFSGSDDGEYCLKCDIALSKSGDELHSAYLKVAALRAEEDGWYADFKERCKMAESRIKELRNERDLK